MPDGELFDKDQLVDNFGLKTTAKWDLIFKLPDITKEILLKAESEGKLERSGDVELSTIHATKGREADNVIILPDMTETTYKGMLKDMDNEHRVYYVAATRAKTNLYIHTPVTNRFYQLPQ
jgi:superfamily I DNA/RNA helicase